MELNDKLPEEMQQKLTSEANIYATSKIGDIQTIPACKINEWEKAADGWEAGATAWAPWKVKYDELQAQAQRMADALGKISNIVSWMEETGARRIAELAETALKEWNIGEGEKKEQLIPTAIYKQQGSKTEANQFKDGKGKEVENDA